MKWAKRGAVGVVWAALLIGGAVYTRNHPQTVSTCRQRFSADTCYTIRDAKRDRRWEGADRLLLKVKQP